MSVSLRVDGVLSKPEGTYGVDAAPTPAENGVRIAERVWSSFTLEDEWVNSRDEMTTGSLDHLGPARPVGRKATVEIVLEAKGPGVAYSASVLPECHPLLQACALEHTVDATGGSETVTYAKIDTDTGSATIWVYAGGWLYKMVGCRGNAKLPIRAGQTGMIRFQMQGIVTADPIPAVLPAITYDSVVAPAAKGIQFGITGSSGLWTPTVQEGEFDFGNDVQLIDDANATDGIASFELSARKSMLTAKVRTSTTYDAYAEHKAVATQAIEFTLDGGQYNTLKLDVDDAHHSKKPSHVDYKGFTGWGLELTCRDGVLIFS